MVKIHYQRFSVLLFMLCGVYVISYFLLSRGMLWSYELFSLAAVTFEGCMIVDNISLMFGGVVTYVSGCVFFFSRYYMAADNFYYRFSWLLLSFVITMNILIFSGSLLILLLGWDGLGVSSFALIMYYQSKESLEASFLTLMINRLGDITIMSSMVLFTMMGSMLLVNYTTMFIYPLLMLLTISAFTKSAQYPFCAWLPAAMAAPTPVSALVHSSTLVTAGVYILIRACSSNIMPTDMCSMLLFFGSVTSFIGGMCAVYENDLKKLIALSTLSQLGVMMFSLGLGMYSLALLHLFTHAMFKALLFLVAGCILLLSFGVQDIRLLGGVTKNSPVLLVFLNVSAFCLMGLPYLSAFFSKHLILAIMWSQSVNMFSVILMGLSTLLSSVYMLRLLKNLNWGPVNINMLNTPPCSLSYYSPMVLLFIGSCCLGSFISGVDTMYTYSIFIPHSYDILMYTLTILGSFTGVVMYKTKGNMMLSSMFYMVPVWYNVNYFSNKLTGALKSLDNGWLEPMTYMSSLKQFFSYINISNKWSSHWLDYAPYLILASGFILSIWLYLS